MHDGDHATLHGSPRLRRNDGPREEDVVNLVIEVTGRRFAEKEVKVATARALWVPAVNNHGGFGRWAFLEVTDPWGNVKAQIKAELEQVWAEAG